MAKRYHIEDIRADTNVQFSMVSISYNDPDPKIGDITTTTLSFKQVFELAAIIANELSEAMRDG